MANKMEGKLEAIRSNFQVLWKSVDGFQDAKRPKLPLSMTLAYTTACTNMH